MMKHVFITQIIIILTILNMLDTNTVAKSEIFFVATKVIILTSFVLIGAHFINFNHLVISTWSSAFKLITSGLIIFLAHEGFELIANTAADMETPEKTLRKAYYAAVIFVVILYMSIATVTLGTLQTPEIIAARDYALAESAKPFLGHGGFIAIAIAVLLQPALQLMQNSMAVLASPID